MDSSMFNKCAGEVCAQYERDGDLESCFKYILLQLWAAEKDTLEAYTLLLRDLECRFPKIVPVSVMQARNAILDRIQEKIDKLNK